MRIVTERELLDLITRARDEEWEELDIAGLDLEVLPPEIGSLVNLKQLVLGKLEENLDLPLGNKLTDLPEDLGQLKKLEILSVVGNRLTTIPKSIEKLTA
jgi:Leucine-rich repeat (LRR) protein